MTSPDPVAQVPAPAPPSHESFMRAAREAFAFLAAFGFVEVLAPGLQTEPRFELSYRSGSRFVVVEGDGRGSGVTVLFATTDRRGTPYYRYVPAAERSLARWSGDQLAMVRAVAESVAAHAQDFLDGSLSVYESLAQPLPSYRRLPGDAHVDVRAQS